MRTCFADISFLKLFLYLDYQNFFYGIKRYSVNIGLSGII